MATTKHDTKDVDLSAGADMEDFHIGIDPAKPSTDKPSNQVQSQAKQMQEHINKDILETVDKSLGNTCQSGCRDNVPDVVIFGEDLFKLLSKASSEAEGWMKSTKAMETPTGIVIQVTTQQRNPDGSYAVAEALTFLPGTRLVERNGLYSLRAFKG